MDSNTLHNLFKANPDLWEEYHELSNINEEFYIKSERIRSPDVLNEKSLLVKNQITCEKP